MSFKCNFLCDASLILLATSVTLFACSRHYDKVCAESYNNGKEVGKRLGKLEQLSEELGRQTGKEKEKTER